MKILSYFPIRRLHIGNYDPTFTPQFVAELADHLPLLEELSLHHHQTHIFQPLQVDLVGFSAGLGLQCAEFLPCHRIYGVNRYVECGISVCSHSLYYMWRTKQGSAQ